MVIALCGLFELASDVDTETRHANKVSQYYSMVMHSTRDEATRDFPRAK